MPDGELRVLGGVAAALNEVDNDGEKTRHIGEGPGPPHMLHHRRPTCGLVLRLPSLSLLVALGCGIEPAPAATEQDEADLAGAIARSELEFSEDLDDDGVPDAMDACLASVPVASVPTARPGCTRADIFRAPDLVVAPWNAAVERIRSRFEEDPEFADVDVWLKESQALAGAMADALRVGERCESAKHWTTMVGGFEEADAVFDAYLETFPESSPHAPETTEADYDGAHGLRAAARVAQSRLHVAMDAASADLEDLQAGCESVGRQASVEATIVDMDEGSGVLTLDDGTSLLLPLEREEWEPGQLAEGSSGVVTYSLDTDTPVFVGFDFGDWGFELLTTPACGELRLVPVQAPYSSTFPVVPERHPFAGYEDAWGSFQLEQGMAFATDSSDCGPNQFEDGKVSWTEPKFALSLSYTTPGQVSKNVSLASALDAADTPIVLPTDMHQILPATLSATHMLRTCSIDYTVLGSVPVCSPLKVIGSTDRTVYAVEARDRCYLHYDETRFIMTDAVFAPTHRVGKIDHAGTNLTTDPGTQLKTRAWAYPIQGGVPSAYPTQLGEGQGFAVFNDHDFFPVTPNLQPGWFADGPPNPGFSGVNRAAAVAWPRVTGEHNGHPFSYSCEVPTLVRDAVGVCSDPTPWANYRLPYVNGAEVRVGQGNNNVVSHNGGQAYAFDFSRTDIDDAWLFAARGGVVLATQDGVTSSCSDFNCCPDGDGNPNNDVACPPGFSFGGNSVTILHQDGTIGWYAHMINGTVAVQAGQRVRRGRFLGREGTTGNSTGPHVHFHVIPATSGWTMPIRFEYDDGNIEHCINLVKGDEVESTNL